MKVDVFVCLLNILVSFCTYFICFGFDNKIWDLTILVSCHRLSFYVFFFKFYNEL